MRKSEKEPKAEKSGAPVPAGREEASGEKKPGRGRKPKAQIQQEEVEVTAQDSGAISQINAVTEPENVTEPESPVQEPAAEGENAREEATGESDNTEESGKEPEPGQGNTDENVSAPVLATTATAQIVESPLKQMKKEFQRRSQVIRDEMLNIQNSFVTIGFQLHWIHRNNMFRVLNYKSIYEYAEKECNIKRTTCCNLICIIENYADRDEQGEVIESIADCYRNYSASQLVAMLGMPEDMKEQVSPDMSVRAINRLKKGGPEPGEVETSSALSEEPAPVKEPEKGTAPEEETVPDDTVREEEPEAGEMQEAESPKAAEDDTAREEEPEGTGTVQMDDDVRELPEEAVPDENIGTLAEIDSYTDYQSMQDELDLIMRNVFAEDSSVRVKIVCVQG